MTLLSHPLTSLPITLPQEPCRDASRQLHTVDARALLARPRRVPWSSSASRPARLPPLPSKMPAGRAAGNRVVWPSTAPSQDAWPCTPGRYWVSSEAHGVPTSIWLFTFTPIKKNYPPPAAGFKYCKGYGAQALSDVVCSVTCCRTNAPIERLSATSLQRDWNVTMTGSVSHSTAWQLQRRRTGIPIPARWPATKFRSLFYGPIASINPDP